MKRINKMEEQFSKHEDLKLTLKKISEENKILKSKVEMFETEKIQIKMCAYCKDYYTPLQNNDVFIISFLVYLFLIRLLVGIILEN